MVAALNIFDVNERMNTNRNKPLIVESSIAAFDADVLQAKQPVLAAFLAPWSRPCQIMASVLQEVAAECIAWDAKIVQINADDNPELSLLYEVQSIPALLFFRHGTLCGRVVGTASKEAILGKLRSFADSDHKPAHREKDEEQ